MGNASSAATLHTRMLEFGFMAWHAHAQPSLPSHYTTPPCTTLHPNDTTLHGTTLHYDTLHPLVLEQLRCSCTIQITNNYDALNFRTA